MNRLHILLTVMVVMAGAFFATHGVLAKVLTGTGGEDTLVGTDGDDRMKGRGGDDRIKGNRGDDKIKGGGGKDKIIPGKGDDKVDAGAGDDHIYARDTDGVDHIDCGGGFDKVETLHRDDKTKRNCERVLSPGAGATKGTTSTTTGTTTRTSGTSTTGTIGTTTGTSTTGTTTATTTGTTDTTGTTTGTTATTGTITAGTTSTTTGTTTGTSDTSTTGTIGTTTGTSTTGAPTETTSTADRVVVVPCGQDLDATVNADDPTIATRFQLAGGCTYTVDATVLLNEGDEIAGPQGTFVERTPAFDPEPTVTIVGSGGVRNVIRAQGTVRLEWVKIVGGTGQYSSGGSPVAGTGSGLAMGMASNTSYLYAVHVTGSDAAGITNAHGTFDRIELDDTTNNPDFLGFTGSGLKAITEVEVRNSYVHDNQGNGLWCDQFCHDSTSHPNGFWIHDNLVVNNGRAGIRFERVGDVADAGEALIENNEVHGNSAGAVRGGVSIHDAQNALVRNNVFGAKSIADVAYLPNSEGVAIRATDSDRSDRPDLFNVDIVGNVLNGEVIKGCELPDEIVSCSEAAAPPLSTDTTLPETILVFRP